MFLGEYECKVDVKGRIILPSNLKIQLPEEEKGKFVVNRGFEQCLVLYPFNEWLKLSSKINSLNFFNKKNRDFARYFFRGATELNMDNNNRILIPKNLTGYAKISMETVLFAYNHKVEIWDKKTYNDLLNAEPEDFSTLAEEVMGG
ncbi:MAG: division/cell wall cluster transcriptional repressor MraZ [Solitalea-like symbiont of Acarus siro]